MQEKLAITVLVIMLALFAWVLVLYNLVKSKGESYNQIVLSHQDYESRTIPYKRGNIIDRNGTYLAISEKVYNLVVDPKQILDTDRASSIRILASFISASVAAPTRITATPPAILASLSCSFSRSKSEVVSSI